MTPDEAAAWEQATLRRERYGFLVYAFCTTTLVPLWQVWDHYLHPQLASTFFGLRVFDSVAGVGIMLALRATNSLTLLRTLGAIKVLLTGGIICVMLAIVRETYMATVIGFSLVFWGTGLALTWPMPHNFVVSVLVVVQYFIASKILQAQHSVSEEIGAFFYLGSAIICSTAGVHVARSHHEHLFLTNLQLERRRAELADAVALLKEAQARLVESEKLSALGRLLANLSHEINNPINVIRNNIPPLREYIRDMSSVLDAAKNTPAEMLPRWQALDIDFARIDSVEALDMIEAAVERVQVIHRELTAFARGNESVLDDVDIKEAVRRTTALLRRNLPAGVTLAEEHAAVPRFPGRTAHIDQVLFNLVQNALDAVGERGTITVRTELADAGRAVELTVTDTGPGVDESARARLFEPFFTTKPLGKGTGLGLAICHQIITSHGGTITLDTAYESGARFVVRFPFEKKRLDMSASGTDRDTHPPG